MIKYVVLNITINILRIETIICSATQWSVRRQRIARAPRRTTPESPTTPEILLSWQHTDTCECKMYIIVRFSFQRQAHRFIKLTIRLRFTSPNLTNLTLQHCLGLIRVVLTKAFCLQTLIYRCTAKHVWND